MSGSEPDWHVRSTCQKRGDTPLFSEMANEPDLDVGDVARLARLKLSDEETRLFQSQLDQVLEHATKLRNVDVTNVEVAAHGIAIFNFFREDEPRDWFSAEEALSNAPQKANGLFIVTKVVE